MTDTPRTTCPAFIARSGIDDLVCFRQEGHPPPWHYDNRGLGAWFRALPDGRVESRIGLATEPDPDSPPQPAPANLPAPYADAAGSLDLDGLRHLAEILRTELPVALRSSVTALRQARGTVITEEDTYDVVRRLTDAGEVLRRVAEAFTAAAREADALIEEEAITVHGEDDGIPRASLYVPDGAGQRIAVRAEYGTGKDSWDLATLAGFLAETTVADEGRKPDVDELSEGEEPDDVPLWTNEEAVSLVRDGIDRLLALGTYAPKVREVDNLRRRHAERGDDASAAVLRQVRQKGERVYRGVKITREDTPASQR
jgi:hypothetical protein